MRTVTLTEPHLDRLSNQLKEIRSLARGISAGNYDRLDGADLNRLSRLADIASKADYMLMELELVPKTTAAD